MSKKAQPLAVGDNVPSIYKGPGSRRFQVIRPGELYYDAKCKVWYLLDNGGAIASVYDNADKALAAYRAAEEAQP